MLDTNVISELRAGKPSPSAAVRTWAAGVPGNQLYLSSITVLELEMGVLAMQRRDPAQGNRLRVWLDAVLLEFSDRILPFGRVAAILCAAMQVPNRRSERDAMIAATSKEHGYSVVTRNTSDFENCDVALINPWVTAEG